MPGASKRFMVGKQEVYLNPDGTYLCKCALFKLASTCAHVQAVQRSIEGQKPKPAVPEPLPPKPAAIVERGKFGARKFRNE